MYKGKPNPPLGHVLIYVGVGALFCVSMKVIFINLVYAKFPGELTSLDGVRIIYAVLSGSQH